MKKLMIMFALFLMIAGATISGMKFANFGPFEEKKKGKVEKVEEEEEETALFVDMTPLVVTIFDGSSVAANIQLEVKLQTRGEKNIITIKRNLPKFKDAFLADLHQFVPRMLREIERIDPLTIKRRLQIVANRVGGKGLVDDVLIQSLLDQPAK